MVANKFRYMVMELVGCEGNRRITQFGLLKAIRQSVQLNFGHHGLACCSPHLQVKYYNPVTSVFVVRCARAEYQKVWCSMTFISSVEGAQTVFNLLLLSGNLRACQKKAMKVDNDKLQMLIDSPGTNLTSQQIEESRSNSDKMNLVEG